MIVVNGTTRESKVVKLIVLGGEPVKEVKGRGMAGPARKFVRNCIRKVCPRRRCGMAIATC